MSIAFQTFSFLAVPLSVHGNMTIAKPAGTVEGDLLIWFAVDDRNDVNRSLTTLPSGWALISQITAPGREDHSATAFLVAGASEPSSYTFQVLPAQNSATVSGILRFSSTKGFPANPIHAFADNALFVIQAPPVDQACLSVNVTKEARVLRLGVQRGAPSVFGDNSFSLAFPPITTEIMDKGTNDAGNRSGLAAFLEDAVIPPGITGSAAIRFVDPGGGSTGMTWMTWTIAMIEATFGGGGNMDMLLDEKGEALTKGQKILNPFGPSKRACMCPIGNCTCL